MTPPEIVVTHRQLCANGLAAQMHRIVKTQPHAVLLREKDLAPTQYRQLYAAIASICEPAGVPLLAHGIAIGERVHLPFSSVLATKHLPPRWSASIHSQAEAMQAEALGAEFLLAGHIFATSCKPNLPPRGLAFLQQVANSVHIPVFAIGGITHQNTQDCLRAGATGVCRMSYYMQISS